MTLPRPLPPCKPGDVLFSQHPYYLDASSRLHTVVSKTKHYYTCQDGVQIRCRDGKVIDGPLPRHPSRVAHIATPQEVAAVQASDAMALMLKEMSGEKAQKLAPLVLEHFAELEAVVLDARRYRWLRKQHWSTSPLAVVVSNPNAIRLGTDCPSADRLDKMIDAILMAESVDSP